MGRENMYLKLENKDKEIENEHPNRCYMFTIDDKVIDGTILGSPAKYINHSCEPNCYVVKTTIGSWYGLLVKALRPIAKGEELSYDYELKEIGNKLECYCRSKNCKKYMN